MENESDTETTSEIDVTDNVDSTEKCDNLRPELGSKEFHSSTDTATNYVQKPSELRYRINMRERKRMHDLNVAMDSLREVMPYANGPSVRKLSKIATLSLARNYIQMLTKSVEEMKQLLDEIYRDSVYNRVQGQAMGYQASLPPRPFSVPLHPRLPNGHSWRSGLRHMSGYAHEVLPSQEHGFSMGIRSMCGEIGNYRMIPIYHSDTALNQHCTAQHSGSSICETAMTEPYKMLKWT